MESDIFWLALGLTTLVFLVLNERRKAAEDRARTLWLVAASLLTNIEHGGQENRFTGVGWARRELEAADKKAWASHVQTEKDGGPFYIRLVG